MIGLIITILIVTFNLLLLFFPQIVLAASRDGLLLWFNNVLPALLPFMIATSMLISLGFAEFFARFTAPFTQKIFNLPGEAGFGILAGLTSGYPMGAKIVADLKKKEQLNTEQAQHLLAFCNNAGPLFVVGVVGVGMFENAGVGYVLWVSHILAALLVGLILRPTGKAPLPVGSTQLPTDQSDAAIFLTADKNHDIPHKEPLGKILGEAVKNAMESMTLIGGLIIFFSVVAAVVGTLGIMDIPLLGGIITGFLEVTGGVRRLVLSQSGMTLPAVAFILAFGGFAVHAQSFHFLAGSGVKAVPYLWAKGLHGAIAAMLTIVITAALAI